MRDRLMSYLEALFSDAADTAKNREMREEVIQNTLDRYDDAIAEGMSEETAFNLAVGGMGDVRELLEQAESVGNTSGSKVPSSEKEEKKQGGFLKVLYRCLAILLWIGAIFLYAGISFFTGAWHITWLLILMAFSLHQFMKSIFDLIGGVKK